MPHNYEVVKPWTEPSILSSNTYYIKYLPIFQHFSDIYTLWAHKPDETNILRIKLHLQKKNKHINGNSKTQLI